MSFDLIAFDLDNTLVNTESVAVNDLMECFQQDFGIPMTAEIWFERYHGMSGEPLMQKVNADFATDVTFEALLPVRNARLEKLFEHGVDPAPGLIQVLRTLVARERRMCIVTNSHPSRNAMLLHKVKMPPDLNLAEIFKDKIFSGVPGNGSLIRPKPAPDAYIAAAEAFGVMANRCVAVEDSPSGARAGIEAGFTVLGYSGLSDHGDIAEKRLKNEGVMSVFKHWDEFLTLLALCEAV